MIVVKYRKIYIVVKIYALSMTIMKTIDQVCLATSLAIGVVGFATGGYDMASKPGSPKILVHEKSTTTDPYLPSLIVFTGGAALLLYGTARGIVLNSSENRT